MPAYTTHPTKALLHITLPHPTCTLQQAGRRTLLRLNSPASTWLEQDCLSSLAAPAHVGLGRRSKVGNRTNPVCLPGVPPFARYLRHTFYANRPSPSAISLPRAAMTTPPGGHSCAHSGGRGGAEAHDLLSSISTTYTCETFCCFTALCTPGSTSAKHADFIVGTSSHLLPLLSGFFQTTTCHSPATHWPPSKASSIPSNTLPHPPPPTPLTRLDRRTCIHMSWLWDGIDRWTAGGGAGGLPPPPPASAPKHAVPHAAQHGLDSIHGGFETTMVHAK